MSHKEVAIRALTQMKGDDTFRAQWAFQDLTPAEMQMQHGRSGRTRAEILAGYIARDAEVDAAIEWVRNQPEHE